MALDIVISREVSMSCDLCSDFLIQFGISIGSSLPWRFRNFNANYANSGRNKTATIPQKISSNAFRWRKMSFVWYGNRNLDLGSIQQSSIWWYNDSAQYRRQTISWSNYGHVNWRICGLLRSRWLKTGLCRLTVSTLGWSIWLCKSVLMC